MTPTQPAAAPLRGGAPADPPGGWAPGPLVRSLLLLVLAATLASGVLSIWLVSRASEPDTLQRTVGRDNDEVELVARMLASKIEQNQRVLAALADGIAPALLGAPAALHGWLQQDPGARVFDSVAVARADGGVVARVRGARAEAAEPEGVPESDTLRQVLRAGKPVVSGVVGSTPAQARVVFAVPMLGAQGRVVGAVAGTLRLQSQSLLPPALALPLRDRSRFIVFTHDGVILSHPQPDRVLTGAAEEPGLQAVLAREGGAQALLAPGVRLLDDGRVVSWAGVALPRWIVARVSDTRASLGPLVAAQQRAWWLAGWSIAAVGVLAALALLWLMRPLTLLRLQARSVLSGGHPAALPWLRQHERRAPGEVSDVVRVFARLVELRRQQQRSSDVLKRQLQEVLDHTPLGIALTRGERIEVVNAQACDLLGYAPAQLLGRDLLRLVAQLPGDEDVIARVRADFAAHGRFKGELPLLQQDGTTLWARVQGEPAHAGEPMRGVVWVLEDGTAERESRLQQDWERWHDPLTYLPNRAALERRLQVLLSERVDRAARRSGAVSDGEASGVLLYLDVDHFTVINEVAGHNAGDDVLRHLSRLLEAEVRQMGWVARLGGDEFAVVLPGATPARASAVADRLRMVVQAWEPAYHGRTFTIGLSIGLVPLEPGVTDVSAVLTAADMACYAAKRAGRDRVELGHVPQPADHAP